MSEPRNAIAPARAAVRSPRAVLRLDRHERESDSGVSLNVRSIRCDRNPKGALQVIARLAGAALRHEATPDVDDHKRFVGVRAQPGEAVARAFKLGTGHIEVAARVGCSADGATRESDEIRIISFLQNALRFPREGIGETDAAGHPRGVGSVEHCLCQRRTVAGAAQRLDRAFEGRQVMLGVTEISTEHGGQIERFGMQRRRLRQPADCRTIPAQSFQRVTAIEEESRECGQRTDAGLQVALVHDCRIERRSKLRQAPLDLVEVPSRVGTRSTSPRSTNGRRTRRT